MHYVSGDRLTALHQAVKKPFRRGSGSRLTRKYLQLDFVEESEAVWERWRSWRPSLIQTVSGDVVSLPVINYSVKKKDFSKQVFWHLHLPRCKNPCEELSLHLGFVIMIKSPPKLTTRQWKLLPVVSLTVRMWCASEWWCVVLLILLEIAEKEKNGKENLIPFVEPSAGVQEFQQSGLLA